VKVFCIIIAIVLSLFNSPFTQVANAAGIKSTDNIKFKEITQMDFKDVHHIEIMNGTTGKFVIIKSSKLIEDIFAFNNATYKIKTEDGNRGGWIFSLPV